MSKLERIQAFIEVIEENSFIRAATKLHISAAAISRQISTLEKELKTQLIKRTTRKLMLTDIGQQYYAECKNTLQKLADIENLINYKQQEASGLLRVTSSRYFAKKYLLPHLKEFLQKFPKITLNLELAERFPDLPTEGIDILIGVSMPGTADLIRRRITTTRYIYCASPSYLKKYGTPKQPNDMLQHRYITHTMRADPGMLYFKNNVELKLKPYLFLNDSKTMLECAIADMGIVRLHDYFVASAIEQKQLQEILRNHAEPAQPVYLFYQQSRYLQAKIRSFIDFYLKKFSAQ